MDQIKHISFLAFPVNGVFSHAYIIWGGSERDRTELSEKLASAIVCGSSGKRPCLSCAHCQKSLRHIHPDIISVDRNQENRLIQIDQIRALREDASVMPNEAEKKVYIIKHAEAINIPAQNAMLKLLEEPPGSASFILVAENPAALLPTVRSRCFEIPADGQDAAPVSEENAEVIAFYAALTGGPLRLTEFSFAAEKLEKNEFLDFINDAKAFMTARLRDSLCGGKSALTSEYLMKTIRVLDRAKEYFELNVGLGHIAGMICAELLEGAGDARVPPQPNQSATFTCHPSR